MKLFTSYNSKTRNSVFVFTFSLSLCFSFFANAQTEDKIGDNPGNKQRSAVLELESTTKGFLLPRMTPAQMASISNPAVGLQIYNTTDSCIYVYRGVSGWYSTCGGFNAWSTFGNTGINPLTNFLGTTDGQPLVVKTNGVERLRFDAAGNINQNGAGAVNLTGYLTSSAGATITGPSAGSGFVNINTVGANTTNIGTVVSTTNINGTNLYIPALPSGSLATDAIVGVNRATGKADTLNINGLVANNVTANNGITKTVVSGVVNVALGGTLVLPTTITSDATNTLAVTGLQHGSGLDSVVLADATTGVLKRATVADIAASGFLADNGLTKTANKVQLGGALIKPSTVTTDATNTLAVAGLQHGTGLDSVVLADAATGVLKRATVSDIAAAGFLADNGLTKTANKVQLGGALLKPSTVTTDATNTLAIDGLQHGTGLDSVVLADATKGTLKRATVADIAAAGFLADNGLTKTANKVQLGGALLKPSTVTTDATNTLAIAGLQHGTGLDSVVLADATTGTLKRATVADIAAAGFLADNGLTKTANKVQLGGTLLQNTAIAQAGFDVNYSGGKIAIGQTTAPNSTLQVTGNMSVSYRIITADYSVTTTSSDQIILADATSALSGITITLPTPSAAIAGRIYTVGKYDESSNLVNFSPSIYVTKTTPVSAVNFPKKYRVVCDGTSWVLYTE